MPSFKITGLDEYIGKLNKLEKDTKKVIGESIYEGAKVVADATKSALQSLPVDNSPSSVYMRKSITSKQRQGLIESYGIAPLRDDKDFLNVKVGFDGYNEVYTYKYPLGQPNAMVARSLESGTSFMKKNPVISRTERQVKQKCIDEISSNFIKKVDEITK